MMRRSSLARSSDAITSLLLRRPRRAVAAFGAIFSCALLSLTVPILQEGVELAQAQVDDSMVHLAEVIAAQLDGDLHETLRSPEQVESAAHAALLEPLIRFQNAIPGIYALYTLRPVDGDLRIVLDTARSTALVRESDPPTALMERLDFDLSLEPELLDTVMAGRSYVDKHSYNGGGSRRWVRSVESPIRDSTGRVVAMLAMDYEDSLYLEKREHTRDSVWRTVLLADFLLLLVAVAILGGLLRRLGNSIRALERDAITDTLTRLANRRHFDECLKAQAAYCRARQEPLGVLLLDADHFKRVNDGFGHPAGDAVLVRIADCLRAECVGSRQAFRIGGEEFALLLPGESSAAAVSAYNRFVAGIGRPIRLASGAVELTMSGGVAVMQASDADADALLLRADRALYAAKAAGRRQVVVADGS